MFGDGERVHLERVGGRWRWVAFMVDDRPQASPPPWGSAGASQFNKGGESLQRSDYRVIFQMGMGLMAQLVAALELPPGK